MGVPAAKVFNLTDNSLAFLDLPRLLQLKSNPYFVRMASAANASILGDALKQEPSFFSLWIGSNDVLLYALDGGAYKPLSSKEFVPAIDRTGDPNYKNCGVNNITDPGLFKREVRSAY